VCVHLNPSRVIYLSNKVAKKAKKLIRNYDFNNFLHMPPSVIVTN